MASTTGRPQVVAEVRDGALALTVTADGDGTARLTGFGPDTGGGPAAGAAAAGPDPAGADPAGAGSAGQPRAPGPAALPLVDVLTPGTGRAWSGARHAESVLGGRLRYRGHSERADGSWRLLVITLADPETGLRAEVHYRILAGCGAFQAWVELANDGGGPLVIEAVTSFLGGGLPGGGDLADLDLWWADSDWLAEGRWQSRPLREALPDTDRRAQPASPRGCLTFTSTGSWSSAVYLPMGALVSRTTGACWAWQIEHNGAWQWEIGERAGAAYLALLGPADAAHQWRKTLAPGTSFTTVPVSIAVSTDGFEGAVAALTRYRRQLRRPHADHRRLPVVFNDYMNTLMADPTTEKLLPLVSAAAAAGAEYFCIDAGWYDNGAGWWDSAGDWAPSAARFPGGLTEVLDHIRAEGMVPGLWLEPEVVGVGTAAARELPAEAFFHRGGVRIAEHGRYHLDLRHPAALRHLDEAVDLLAGDLGIGYLKLDYNIRADPGTDSGGLSAGAGLLEHNRALLGWLDRVLDRHPGLTIENCASGAMRADYAMLARLQLQSTSDQQDFLRYPVIAAAAPAAITPEQAGIWCYPQPHFSTGEIAFTLCGALLGRIHLSGHLDRMSPAQRELIAGAVSVYKQLRPDLADAVPFWPLGLPRWLDSWVALGMRGRTRSYLLAWRRGPRQAAGSGQALVPGAADGGGPAAVTLPVRHLRGRPAAARVLFPAGTAARSRWDAAAGELAVTLPAAPAAALICLAAD